MQNRHIVTIRLCKAHRGNRSYELQYNAYEKFNISHGFLGSLHSREESSAKNKLFVEYSEDMTQ